MTHAHSIDAFDHQTNGAFHDDALIDCNIAELHYGKFEAVRDVAVKLKKDTITALIGPSGCGKSMVLRCLNRMNDLVRGFRLKDRMIFRGQDIYAPKINPVAVRWHIGLVFQQTNPFAMSAFRLRLNRYKGDIEDEIEQALRQAGLCNEIKDKIRASTPALSGGQ